MGKPHGSAGLHSGGNIHTGHTSPRLQSAGHESPRYFAPRVFSPVNNASPVSHASQATSKRNSRRQSSNSRKSTDLARVENMVQNVERIRDAAPSCCLGAKVRLPREISHFRFVPEINSTKLLKKDLGNILTECLTSVIQVRPEDPIEYIAHYLYKAADVELYYKERAIYNKECMLLLLAHRRHQEKRRCQIMAIHGKMNTLRDEIERYRGEYNSQIGKRGLPKLLALPRMSIFEKNDPCNDMCIDNKTDDEISEENKADTKRGNSWSRSSMLSRANIQMEDQAQKYLRESNVWTDELLAPLREARDVLADTEKEVDDYENLQELTPMLKTVLDNCDPGTLCLGREELTGADCMLGQMSFVIKEVLAETKNNRRDSLGSSVTSFFNSDTSDLLLDNIARLNTHISILRKEINSVELHRKPGRMDLRLSKRAKDECQALRGELVTELLQYSEENPDIGAFLKTKGGINAYLGADYRIYSPSRLPSFTYVPEEDIIVSGQDTPVIIVEEQVSWIKPEVPSTSDNSVKVKSEPTSENVNSTESSLTASDQPMSNNYEYWASRNKDDRPYKRPDLNPPTKQYFVKESQERKQKTKRGSSRTKKSDPDATVQGQTALSNRSIRDGDPIDVGSREGGSREGGSKEGGSREGGFREGGSREVGSKEGGSREVGSREYQLSVGDIVSVASKVSFTEESLMEIKSWKRQTFSQTQSERDLRRVSRVVSEVLSESQSRRQQGQRGQQGQQGLASIDEDIVDIMLSNVSRLDEYIRTLEEELAENQKQSNAAMKHMEKVRDRYNSLRAELVNELQFYHGNSQQIEETNKLQKKKHGTRGSRTFAVSRSSTPIRDMHLSDSMTSDDSYMREFKVSDEMPRQERYGDDEATESLMGAARALEQQDHFKCIVHISDSVTGQLRPWEIPTNSPSGNEDDDSKEMTKNVSRNIIIELSRENSGEINELSRRSSGEINKLSRRSSELDRMTSVISEVLSGTRSLRDDRNLASDFDDGMTNLIMENIARLEGHLQTLDRDIDTIATAGRGSDQQDCIPLRQLEKLKEGYTNLKKDLTEELQVYGGVGSQHEEQGRKPSTGNYTGYDSDVSSDEGVQIGNTSKVRRNKKYKEDTQAAGKGSGVGCSPELSSDEIEPSAQESLQQHTRKSKKYKKQVEKDTEECQSYQDSDTVGATSKSVLRPKPDSPNLLLYKGWTHAHTPYNSLEPSPSESAVWLQNRRIQIKDSPEYCDSRVSVAAETDKRKSREASGNLRGIIHGGTCKMYEKGTDNNGEETYGLDSDECPQEETNDFDTSKLGYWRRKSRDPSLSWEERERLSEGEVKEWIQKQEPNIQKDSKKYKHLSGTGQFNYAAESHPAPDVSDSSDTDIEILKRKPDKLRAALSHGLAAPQGNSLQVTGEVTEGKSDEKVTVFEFLNIEEPSPRNHSIIGTPLGSDSIKKYHTTEPETNTQGSSGLQEPDDEQSVELDEDTSLLLTKRKDALRKRSPPDSRRKSQTPRRTPHPSGRVTRRETRTSIGSSRHSPNIGVEEERSRTSMEKIQIVCKWSLDDNHRAICDHPLLGPMAAPGPVVSYTPDSNPLLADTVGSAYHDGLYASPGTRTNSPAPSQRRHTSASNTPSRRNSA